MVRILYRVSYGCFILMVRVGVPPALWYTAAAFIAAASGAQEKMVVEIAWSLHCSLESAALVVPEPLPLLLLHPLRPVLVRLLLCLLLRRCLLLRSWGVLL